MPVLADAFAYVAGYNIRMMLIMQSKAQLRDRDLYGPDKAEAILDNCGLEVVFGTKDLKLTEELSARLGYDTVEGRTRSGPRFWQALHRDKLNMTESDQRRALLLPQEIARMGPLDAILVRPGIYPIRCKRIRYFRDKTFSRLVRQPPVVPPIDVVVRLDQGKGFKPIATAVLSSTPASAPAPAPASASVPASAAPSSAAAPTAVTPAKPPAKRKKVAEATKRSKATRLPTSPHPTSVVAQTDDPAPALSAMQPHQSDGLLNAIMGADVDLSGLGLADGKAAVAAIVDAIPTVESLTRGRKRTVA